MIAVKPIWLGRLGLTATVLLGCWLAEVDFARTDRPLGPAASDPVLVRGLEHTLQDRPLAEKAASLANNLLATTGYRLDVSWESKASSNTQIASVPVYLVAAPASAPSTPAAVPSGCRCVFVNPATLGGWIK